jgi:dUTPase
MPVNETCVLKYVRLTDKAFAPKKGSEKSAGYDLRRYKLLFICFLYYK